MALVLSRKMDEVIMIGDDIEVTVIDIRGDKVRLAVKAPKEIPIHRKEVWEYIKSEQKKEGKNEAETNQSGESQKQ